MLIVKDSLLSNLELHLVEKSSLFFGQYRYSARFSLNELGVIRGLRYDKIDELVRDRNVWRQDNRNIYAGYRHIISAHEVADLKTVCQALIPHEKDIKFVISYNTGYVYTNNINVLNEIRDIPCIRNFYAQQAVEICPPGTIALKNPKWTHRTYLRSKQLNEKQKNALVEYLTSRENIRLSPGFRQWTTRTIQYWSNYTQDYFFFDHNNDGEVLFLNMVMHNITGRTLKIVAK